MDPLTLNLEPIEFGYGIFPKDLSLDLGGGRILLEGNITFRRDHYFRVYYLCIYVFTYFCPKALKYWVGVKWGQSYLMGRRSLLL